MLMDLRDTKKKRISKGYFKQNDCNFDDANKPPGLFNIKQGLI